MSISTMDYSLAWDLLRRTPGFVLILFLIRYSLIKFLWTPLGAAFKINPFKAERVSPIPRLEKLYQSDGLKALKNGKALAVAKQQCISIDEVKNWFKLRDKQDEEPDLDKFGYECWMTTYYFVFNIYGLLILPRKNWFWDVEDCWGHLSSHSSDLETVIYLTIGFAFFIVESSVLLLKQYDRRDYYIIRVHHIISGGLIVFCFHFKIIRICCLTLFLLELITPFPYVSRLARRAQCLWIADLSFACSSILWVITRVFLFHLWILPSYVNFRKRSEKYTFGYVTLDFLVVLLFATNMLWSLTISKKFYKAFFSGKYRNPWKTLSLKLAERG